MEEQEHNSRTRRNMNWSDGSVLVDCGIQNWGTCFSTICMLELLSEVTLKFPQPEMWGKLKQLLFWSRIVIKLYTSSFLLSCVLLWQAEDFLSSAKSSLPGNQLFLGKFSHFSTWDSFAQGWQSIPLGASFPGNLPLYNSGDFHALEPYKGLNSSVPSHPYMEV